jgi:hypothetical protein
LCYKVQIKNLKVQPLTEQEVSTLYKPHTSSKLMTPNSIFRTHRQGLKFRFYLKDQELIGTQFSRGTYIKGNSLCFHLILLKSTHTLWRPGQKWFRRKKSLMHFSLTFVTTRTTGNKKTLRSNTLMISLKSYVEPFQAKMLSFLP